MSLFLTRADLPFCKGCGHHLVARNTVRALEKLQLTPLDVVLVTDIGCHGIVDAAFATHTVHGLHGRSVALGAGIAMGLPAGKKVIIYLGDGGATIGLQHILEAARLNVDVTVVVHNNMLYGMTGGQPSGLTPCGFRTNITPEGHALAHHDLCRLVRDAGAAYAARVVGLGDYSETIRDALVTEGFALVEVLELCIAYGAKLNPDLRLRELARQAGYEPGLWTVAGEVRPAFRPPRRENRPDLLALPEVPVQFVSPQTGRIALVLSGSAGEGVQLAAGLLCRAAMSAGLTVTRKGSYPVTVGVGFSTAEVILSRDPIEYHGVTHPDAVIITSGDGLSHNRNRIQQMAGGILWVDASLPQPETGAEVRVRDFRGWAGPRHAAIAGVLTWSQEAGIVPLAAMLQAVRDSPVASRLPADLLADHA